MDGNKPDPKNEARPTSVLTKVGRAISEVFISVIINAD